LVLAGTNAVGQAQCIALEKVWRCLTVGLQQRLVLAGMTNSGSSGWTAQYTRNIL
jgi:hypothetical protein